jgi:hypothetical protein
VVKRSGSSPWGVALFTSMHGPGGSSEWHLGGGRGQWRQELGVLEKDVVMRDRQSAAHGCERVPASKPELAAMPSNVVVQS